MQLQVKTSIPTKWGRFHLYAFGSSKDDLMPHLAIVKDFNSNEPVILRIHSECFTGDVMGSTRCDCGDQFKNSMQLIGENGGLLIYLRQEGRGIGLINKMMAYNVQDEQGLNTIDANVHLGFEPDERSYEIAVDILKYFDIKKLRILTNNPEKIAFLENCGLEIIERLPIKGEINEDNLDYLNVKKDLMGHFPDLT
ncbi:MAG: GTP cyclohydrolase II [Saprospirales bacterium]|nr:MAG: GTP cyclohydrolase II [Saprospirales bacterium]